MSGTPLSPGSLVPGDDPIEVIDPPPSALFNGEKLVAVAGTRTALVAVSTPLKVGVIIRALNANGAALIYVGNATVIPGTGAARGQQLSAGESTSVAIDDLNKVYIDSDTSGAGVTFIGS